MKLDHATVLAVAILGLACSSAVDNRGGDDSAPKTVELQPSDYDNPGRYVVAHRTFKATDPKTKRELIFEVWYPSVARVDANGKAATVQTGKTEGFVTEGADAKTLASQLATSATQCTTRNTGAHRDGPATADTGPSANGLPAVVFSHCHTCIRFSSFSIAERLASHGIVVIAPDHAGNTMFDSLAGKGGDLSKKWLDLRVGDVKFALDMLVDPAATALPQAVRGRIDPARVGIYGHSFGSVTAGALTQADPRIKAVAGLAAPMENPLIPGVKMANIKVPVLFVVAREDNSITEVGNTLIRGNFDAAKTPAWKLEIDDAGHFSVADLAGLADGWFAGCGKGVRQTDGSPFTYIPVAEAINITARWVSAFFAAHLAEEPAAKSVLGSPPTDKRAHIKRRNQ